MLTKNIIALQKGFTNLPDAMQDNLVMAMTTNHQLMTYGWMLDQSAFNQLKRADTADIIQFHNDTVNWLKEMTGGSREFKSLYGNFPLDVMSKSRLELFIDQIAHYWGKKTFNDESRPKEEAFEHVNYKMLTAGDDEKFGKIFTDLCGVGQSLTVTDTNILKWFVVNWENLIFPETIPFKENLAILATVIPSFKPKTVTDVLRIACVWSGMDAALLPVPKKPKKKTRFTEDKLAERAKFKFKLTDAQKVRILQMLETSNLSLSEMKQGSKYNRWIRLGEQIGHIDKTIYPMTAQAFYKLRNQKRAGKPNGEPVIRTWYSHVESAFKSDFTLGVEKLAERPGEFIRKLDWLIRKGKNTDVVLATLSKVAERVSNKVLFEVYTHFENRKDRVTGRSIFVKGARSRTPLPDLPAINQKTIAAIQDTVITAIKSKFEFLPELGNCWLDEQLKNIPLPTNMRSLSESLVPIIRGQRIPIGNTKKVIRPFVHWYDERGNEDLDLHGFLFGDKGAISFGFNGYYNNDFGTYSGDVRNRQGSCAEYVDINVKNAVSAGYKYFAMVVHNFQTRPFSSLKECYVGCMERDNAEVNKTWKPDTVTVGMKLNSTSTMCLVGVYDLETREYIHLDLDWNTFSGYVRAGNSTELFKAIAPYIAPPKLSVYDLLKWHIEARGKMVSLDQIDHETKIYRNEDFCSDYTETLKWMGI